MFQCVELILEIIRMLRPLVRQVARHDRDLARQIRRAANGTLLNASEGNQRKAGDRLYLFSTSRGSASEVSVALRGAVEWGYLGEEQIEEVEARLDSVRAILWRLENPR